MIERANPNLSITRQCRILSIGRSSFYYAAKGENETNLALMRRIDELSQRDGIHLNSLSNFPGPSQHSPPK